MRGLRAWWLRLVGSFRQERPEQELAEELRSHLRLHMDENMRAGMSPEQARRDALLKLGGVEATKELYRERRGLPLLETFLQDVRFALRMLRKNPGFTSVAVLTLALGIGANTAIFSVINGVLLSPPPYKNPQQLVVMKQNDSLPNVTDIQKHASAFSQGGGINVMPMDYTGGTEPVQIRVGLVNAGFLETLGVQPMLGGIISPREDVRGGPRFAVVSYPFWQTYLGSHPQAMNQEILLGGNSYTVIGVMPASFAPPVEHADVFVSLWVGYPEAAAY